MIKAGKKEIMKTRIVTDRKGKVKEEREDGCSNEQELRIRKSVKNGVILFLSSLSFPSHLPMSFPLPLPIRISLPLPLSTTL